MPAAAAIGLTALLSAGASNIAETKQRKLTRATRDTQTRVRAEDKRQQNAVLASDVREGRQQRDADAAAQKVTAGKARQIKNQNLARRGISPFGEISEAILDEGAKTV